MDELEKLVEQAGWLGLQSLALFQDTKNLAAKADAMHKAMAALFDRMLALQGKEVGDEGN